ncbi:MAG: hypothetical protein H7329_17825 [Opitutaceae bacterium]|nr:hypothetical protein [Cytophagales bacterium]
MKTSFLLLFFSFSLGYSQNLQKKELHESKEDKTRLIRDMVSTSNGFVEFTNDGFFFYDKVFLLQKHVKIAPVTIVKFGGVSYTSYEFKANGTTAFSISTLGDFGRKLPGVTLNELYITIANRDGNSQNLHIIPDKKYAPCLISCTTEEGLYYLLCNLEGALNYEWLFVANDGTYKYIPTDFSLTSAEIKKLNSRTNSSFTNNIILKLLHLNKMTNNVICYTTYCKEKDDYFEHIEEPGESILIKTIELNLLTGKSTNYKVYEFPTAKPTMRGYFIPKLYYDTTSKAILACGLFSTSKNLIPVDGQYFLRYNYSNQSLQLARFDSFKDIIQRLGVKIAPAVESRKTMYSDANALYYDYIPLSYGTDPVTGDFVFSFKSEWAKTRYVQYNTKGDIVNIWHTKIMGPKVPFHASSFDYGKTNGHPIDGMYDLAQLYKRQNIDYQLVSGEGKCIHLILEKGENRTFVYWK